MIKILFGVVVTVCVLNYSAEMKKFTVESGMRDMVVTYLKGW